MADVMVALDRADLPPEAIDTAVRALTDEGVDVLDVPVEDDTFSEAEIRQAERGAAADSSRGKHADAGVGRPESFDHRSAARYGNRWSRDQHPGALPE